MNRRMSASKDRLLDGKMAFIAGGTSVINLGIAKHFAQLGARVVVAGRNGQGQQRRVGNRNRCARIFL